MYAWIEVVLISIGVSLFSRIVTILMVDQKKFDEIQEETKKLRKKMKGLKMGSNEHLKISEKLTNMQLQLTKLQLKPSIITLAPLVFILMWMRKRYAETGAFLKWGFKLPIIGNDAGWLLTYFACVMLFTTLIKKVENLWRKKND